MKPIQCCRIAVVSICGWLLSVGASGVLSGQEKQIRFQVTYPRTLAAGTAQKWLNAISQAGADGVRLAVNPESNVRFSESRVGKKTIVTVYAAIDGRDRLHLPGKILDLGDRGTLKAWLAEVRARKSVDPEKQPAAFGLSAEELVKVHGKLSVPYKLATRGKNVKEILQQIRSQIGMKIQASEATLALLREKTLVPDELKGVSCGTLLAAVIRPLGLVYSIDDSGTAVRIVDSRNAGEHWPIGWPPQENLRKIAPSLFKRTEFEISGFTLQEVLHALEKKTEVPFVIDQNSLARAGVELDLEVVEIARTRTFYENIIRLVLNQVKPRLIAEVRMDEAGKPFLWVTTASKTR